MPSPEGSYAFLRAYDKAKRAFEAEHAPPPVTGHTVADAITSYLGDASFSQLRPNTRSDYRRTLDKFRIQMGHVAIAGLNESAIDVLRDKSAADPVGWNSLRSRMIEVVRKYRRANPGKMPANPWESSKRLKVAKSDANRPWPADVLLKVLKAATPEFRALLIGYLLTSQRGSDVTVFAPSDYDATAKTLRVRQVKTGEDILLHVPPSLAATIEAMAGRHPDRLFVTPRGKPWTTANAQETLATLLKTLTLPRYTLHGLRATGPVALKMLGVENRAIRALTGHTSDANLETYLKGVDRYVLAKASQDSLDEQFASVLVSALEGANTGKAAGITGRAAAKSKAGMEERVGPKPSSTGDVPC
ncbi:tyrosine-type recombinase/integrase [Acidisoma sp. L85]|uniref:tyrosine-type recombinase/integrase n=1 Tax=Acidisoma sp. L85 TaxID=1641850 RepID=UPI00131A9816|nr:tyrosine-type recombinase/integrase [Acidisoma sp. L85]